MAGGGVCAVLDYEVEHMAEFVAEMATSVVTPGSAASSSFRKFIAGILSSTRLPKSTILLGMNYLAKRMNMPEQSVYHITDADLWRMATVSLILASKFLDDNTFQNRSWAEVSGIAVTELNAMEKKWLVESSFGLYVNLDFSRDYNAWLKSWDDWKVLKEQAVARANRDRLASLVPAIDTDLTRYSGRNSYNAWVQQQAAEYERYQSIKRGDMAQTHSYRMGPVDWSANSSSMGWPSAPLTPPDSGYGTPEYMNSASSANARYNEWFSSAAANGQWNARYQQQPVAHGSYYGHRHATYPQHYAFNQGQGIWEHGIAECSCPNCVAPVKQHGYFGQPVMS
ncbi:Meiotically up-regulated gene 80 protein like [Verticillium longisporum]